MQKTEFLNPEVEVIEFEAEDVITLSFGGTGTGPETNVEDLMP